MQKSCACKFLYGSQTEIEKIEEIEKSLENKVEMKTEVMFRTKDGSEFCCLLDIVPIRNEKGEVVLFLASHKDITHTKMSSFMFKDGEDEEDDDDIQTDLFGDEKPPNGIYQRRRSRAVLYHLSGHLKEQEKKRRKLKLNSTLLAPKQTNLPEYKVAAMQKSQFIFLHYSTFKTIWDCIILLATFYIAVVVPYNVSFLSYDDDGKPRKSKTIVPDIIVEVLFILDLVINFRTTFVSKDGTVIYHPPQIAINYLKTWFFVDLVAAIPFDLITLIFSIDTIWKNIGMLKIVRLLRLLRVKIDRYSQYSAIVLVCLTLGFGLLAHWLACIWYIIGTKEIEKNEDQLNWQIGWINELTVSLGQSYYTNLTLQSQYVTALYYTLSSMTSVGFGNVSANTDAEKIFTIIVMLIGALSHAAVFGNVTALIQRMYARRALYHTKCKDLKDFIQSHNVPLDLKNRMQDYFQTSWSVNMGIDEIEMLQMFPEELRADISMHLNKEILSLPIFQEASQGCRRSLSLRMKSAFSAPGEYLIHKGDALNMIYFVLNGSLEVLRSGMVAAILGKGDLFGCDLYDTDSIIQSNGDVHALTYCDIQSISRQSLLEVLHNYPEYLESFKEEIARDLTFNLREGADYETDKIAFGNTEKNIARSRLPSINEDDEDHEAIDTRSNNSDTKTMETSFKEKGGHLEVNTSSGGGVPPELSPRVVDGIEDEKQYKCQSFDFHNSMHPRRRGSSILENRKGIIEQYEMDMHNYTSPQLAVQRSCSSESMNTEELRHEIESTRNSVERLDKQVFNLSQDVTNLSQDLKSILRLLHVISPLPPSPNSPEVQGTNHLQTHPKVLTVKIEQSGNQRYEDIIHVQRQDGLLETSIGSGILGNLDKETVPEKQSSKNPTNVTLLPQPSDRPELGRAVATAKSREDDSGQYDSENGTEL
ncbi:potassium voltage-gated channel subfamily H member 8-like isoform X2 [Anneissia japonica]|uniref:potassium voltage-gated channel subfamily H member 8-like isoform X2 n=1 Tax=Anneissia japonica TaxID=1529436 RepID=UPI0014254E45|nr:potassium voltage-gated channel subfamily H member 8-like isoform X2 [Anneissia japonica]